MLESLDALHIRLFCRHATDWRCREWVSQDKAMEAMQMRTNRTCGNCAVQRPWKMFAANRTHKRRNLLSLHLSHYWTIIRAENSFDACALRRNRLEVETLSFHHGVCRFSLKRNLAHARARKIKKIGNDASAGVWGTCVRVFAHSKVISTTIGSFLPTFYCGEH